MDCDGKTARMHWGYQIDEGNTIVIGGVHDGQDCFHPLGLIGENRHVSMLFFGNQASLREFIRQLAQISVNMENQALLRLGQEVETLMSKADAMFKDDETA